MAAGSFQLLASLSFARLTSLGAVLHTEVDTILFSTTCRFFALFVQLEQAASIATCCYWYTMHMYSHCQIDWNSLGADPNLLSPFKSSSAVCHAQTHSNPPTFQHLITCNIRHLHLYHRLPYFTLYALPTVTFWPFTSIFSASCGRYTATALVYTFHLQTLQTKMKGENEKNTFRKIF